MLRYHRRLRMISEALELIVNGGRDNHSWCMCVVGHGYGELGVGARIEVVGGMHVGKARRIGRMSGDAGALRKCEVKTLMTSLTTLPTLPDARSHLLPLI